MLQAREIIWQTCSLLGKIYSYNQKRGYGFILPEDPSSLPKQVKIKLAEGRAELEEAGKEVWNDSVIWFDEHDVYKGEGFKLEKDVYVYFQVYIDDRGAGACEVYMAEE